MRLLLPLLVAVLVCGCAGTGYRDTNAQVDANPLCASRQDRPGEPVAPECRRTQEATMSSERTSSQPIDFSGKRKDD